MVGETDFPASGNHFFFSIFQRHLSVFYRLVEKYFSTKSFTPAGGNGLSGQWEPFPFAQRFSSELKPSLKINGSQFLKKNNISANEN